MNHTSATFRSATPRDVKAMAGVDGASWPVHLAVTPEQAAARVAAYAEGQLVAELSGEIVAVVWAQRVTNAFFAANSARYDTITDNETFTASCDPQGAIYQLVGVGTLPAARGERLGRKLVDRQIERARSLPGVERIVGFTRPTGYHAYDGMPLEDYLQLRDERGRLIDRVVAFHLEAGAKIVGVYPDFRPEDVDSRGYGVLIEYPV